ncbi:V-type proton ATPase subunit a, partial [Gryllus bimaculatus]
MPFPKHPPSIFRSEEMVLCQFFLQDEVAFACIEALGHMDAVQFQDLNLVVVPREKPYFAELEILEQAQGFLNYLETQIKKKKMKMAPADDDVPTPIPGDLLDIKFTIQKLLFLVAVICIPWLLLAKPMVVFHQMAQ